MANQPSNEVLLNGPETYHDWFSMITGSFPKDLWKYVDPERDNEFEIPEAPTFDQIREGAESFRDLNAGERTQWSNLKSSFKHEESNYHRYLSEETKLRNRIFSTVGEAKRSLLRADKTLRSWIVNIQTASKPTDDQMKDHIRTRHRSLLGSKYTEWPKAGPEKWLTEWLRLMGDCERWHPALHGEWAVDFNLAWGEVPGAKWVCHKLVDARRNGQMELWDIYRAARELRQDWEDESSRTGMKNAGKGKTTRSTFGTFPKFDGKGADTPPDEHRETETPQPLADTTIVERSRNRSASRKRAGTGSTQKEGETRGQKKSQRKCWGCGGPHIDFKCPLITNYNPFKTKIQTEWKETFDKKMTDRTFEKKVELIRDANKVRRELARSQEAEEEAESERE
jgi:hypothetical protein